MQSRVLYGDSTLHFAWRAILTLEEKQLDYELKRMDMSTGENKGAEYLKLNPRGQMPTLKDGDIIVNESGAIVMYLDRNYPEHFPLVPNEKARSALVLQRFFEACTTDRKVSDAILMKIRGEINTPDDEERYQANLLAAKNDLKIWNDHFSKDKFAAGDEFLLADVILIPLLLTVQRHGAEFKEFPNLKAYIDTIKERPSVKKSIPTEWLETQGTDHASDI